MNWEWVLGWLSEPEALFLQRTKVENTRTSGPGGQKKNKVASGVRLSLREFSLSTVAGEFREPKRNKRRALEKLRLAIVLDFFHKVSEGEESLEREA